MGKKQKRKTKQATASAEAKTTKPLNNFGTGPRVQRTWVERNVLRAQRACKQILTLCKSLDRGKPPTFMTLPATLSGLAEAHKFLDSIGAGVAALPADWKPKRRQVNRAGVAIGDKIGVTEEARKDVLFKFLKADDFENAEILAEDGKQNWLVKCDNGQVRTIRKMFVELVTDEAELLDDAEVPEDDGEVDPEDDDSDEE